MKFLGAILYWGAALPPLMVSVAYLLASPPSVPFAQRFAVSVHGAAIALLFIGALLTTSLGHSKQEYGQLYGLLLLVPAASIVYSVWRFTGRKWLHLLQIINLIWLVLAFFIGGMAVTDLWI
jgi:hypothetical protein